MNNLNKFSLYNKCNKNKCNRNIILGKFKNSTEISAGD